MATSQRTTVMKIALAAALVSCAVFLRTWSWDFVNYDDPHYVYENPAIRLLDWRFVTEAFTTSYMGWWMPLTWISFAIDYRLWGLNPAGYHLENVLLHGANTVLVVLIAARLLRGRVGERLFPAAIFFAALLWGIHPLRVESVAWVTERKDVLNGFFSLAAMHCYLLWTDRGAGTVPGRHGQYLLALFFFTCSLLAKPISVVLPVMFLVLDWYPLGRLERGVRVSRLLEKLPFFLLSALLVVITLFFASGENILIPLGDHPLTSRILVAGYGLGEYLRMSIWPSGLVHYYPIYPDLPPRYYVHTVLVTALLLHAVRVRREKPLLLACLILFILPLLPVLGFLQNGDQSHANRFTYLPAVFPSMAVAAAIVSFLDCSGKESMLRAIHALIAGILVVLGWLSVVQTGYWRNSDTLWSRLIAVQPIGRAFFFRGEHLLRTGEYDRAAADFAVAAGMAAEAGNPELFNLHALRGDALSRGGHFAEAVDEFSIAIRLNPAANYFYHRGLALRSLGRHGEAAADFAAAGNDNRPIAWQKLAEGEAASRGMVHAPGAGK